MRDGPRSLQAICAHHGVFLVETVLKFPVFLVEPTPTLCVPISDTPEQRDALGLDMVGQFFLNEVAV